MYVCMYVCTYVCMYVLAHVGTHSWGWEDALVDRQLKFPSGTRGKLPFWAKSWPGSLLEANFGNLRAFGPAIKIPRKQISAIWRPLGRQLKSPSGTLGKRPFWAKSWPGALWKQISAIWGPLGRQLKSPSGTLGKRPFWAKSWPGALWKQISAIWGPLGRQLKSPSGTLGKRPVLGQILAGSLLEANFGNLKALGPAMKNILLQPFGPNPGREPFGSKF